MNSIQDGPTPISDRLRTPQRVLVCGSLDWTDARVIQQQLSQLPPGSTVIHGGIGYDAEGNALREQPDHLAVCGADMLAGAVAERLGLTVERYPVDPVLDGPWPNAGRQRNARMLTAAKPTRGLAFLTSANRDTRDMIRKMEAAGIQVRVVEG